MSPAGNHRFWWGYARIVKLLISYAFWVGNELPATAQVAFGVGATYGTDINQFGPNFRLYYFPNDLICIGPEFSWFSIKDEGVERDLTEYNISAHFIFEVSHTTALFPLMGINYSREKETIGGMVSSEEAFGLNLGGGAHWVLGRF